MKNKAIRDSVIDGLQRLYDDNKLNEKDECRILNTLEYLGGKRAMKWFSFHSVTDDEDRFREWIRRVSKGIRRVSKGESTKGLG